MDRAIAGTGCQGAGRAEYGQWHRDSPCSRASKCACDTSGRVKGRRDRGVPIAKLRRLL